MSAKRIQREGENSSLGGSRDLTDLTKSITSYNKFD